jgi:hypothetical protein
MKHTLKWITALTLITIMNSCGGNDNDPLKNAGPKEVFTAFAESIVKKDFDRAATLSTSDTRVVITHMKNRLESDEPAGESGELSITERFKKIKISVEKEWVDAAAILVTEKTTGKELYIPMKKENGRWLVDWTPQGMKNINMEETSENKGPADNQ